jgi:SAM-dependent methyltransferase
MTAFDGRAYQDRFDALAERGVDVHGEASLVRSLNPASVLDAGCGTGRVAVELARHGIDVVGVDVDRSMITEARRRAPGLEWVLADLASLTLGRQFDVVVLAGNVPLFCPAARRPALVGSCAAHVGPGGALVAGFQLNRGYDLAEFDRATAAAGLVPADRWSTWDGRPFIADGDYAVTVCRRPSAVG